jgi:hypothetical protein
MAKKFDFLSPGIEIREIDQSFIPVEREAEGPIIIGRTRKGPANKPVKVRNLDDYVSVFGAPIPGGNGPQGDVWRDGNTSGPTYASYAAQAWLASGESSVTIVRLAGDQHPAAATDSAKAGWKLKNGDTNSSAADNSSAYGLFVVASGSTHFGTGSLAAIFYADTGFLTLQGAAATDSGTDTTVTKAGQFVKSSGPNCEFKMKVFNSDSTSEGIYHFNFARNSSKYIRTVFNTNPQLVNGTTVASDDRKTHWLGESFARELVDLNLADAAEGAAYGILLPLESGSVNWSYHKEAASKAQTGWIVSQKEKQQTDLFRLKCLHTGEDIQKDYMIAIEQISAPSNQNVNPYGSFTVAIKNMSGQTVEKFAGCDLNPASPNYIAKKIGDQYLEWDNSDRRYRVYGDYQNQSDLVYIELKQFIKDGGGQGYLPAGFRGPVRPKGFTLAYGSAGANAFGDDHNSGTYTNGEITVTGTGSNGATILITAFDGTEYTIDFDTSVTGAAGSGSFDENNLAKVGINGTWPGVEENSASVGALILPILTSSNTPNGPRFMATALSYNGDDGSGYVIGVSASNPGTKVWTWSKTGDSDGYITLGSITAGTDTDDFAGAMVKGNDSVPSAAGNSTLFAVGPWNYTASFNFPSLPLRSNGTEGSSPDPYRAYYGLRPKLSTTSNQNDPDYCDYLRRLPTGADSFTPGADYEHSFIFSIDDLVINTSNNTVTYTSGSWSETSNDSTTSFTSPSNGTANQNGTFAELLDLNVRQFLLPLYGGFEGFDITEKEPYRDDLISATRNDTTDPIHFTLNKALDSVRDPEVVPANLIMMPGIRKPSITDRMIAIADERKDVLAIVDIENDYKPIAERTTSDTESTSLGAVQSAVSSVKTRNLNSSYACAFYPWVQLSDNLNGSQLVWVPPSVAAVGAFGRSQAQSDVWFAPAGFNRGGLGSLGGSRGPRVVQARQRLDSGERDKLYEVNINPIATFPAEGLVIFGQKTLQADASALDRINVRRLLIYLKSEISDVARSLLFDNNIPSTWARFTSQVNPILADVKARYGLTDYKLILDDSTTTADLIDRNIMYAKIFIKPARAIEYIVVDFVITRSGADFV